MSTTEIAIRASANARLAQENQKLKEELSKYESSSASVVSSSYRDRPPTAEEESEFNLIMARLPTQADIQRFEKYKNGLVTQNEVVRNNVLRSQEREISLLHDRIAKLKSIAVSLRVEAERISCCAIEMQGDDDAS